MAYEIVAEDGKARAGILKTKTGRYETPIFMPVATKGAVKLVSAHSLEEIGVDALIANAFLLYLKPGLDVIEKHGGIHRFMNWKKCIFTDSGGFQVLSLSDFKSKFSDNGLLFKSPFDGKEHLLNPKKVMEIEEKLGSDVAMALDQMPLYGSTKKDVIEATKRTHLWAENCLKEHKDDKQLLFGIAQGSVFKDLRKKSTEFISKLDFDGVALGGLCIGEPKQKMMEMARLSVRILPKNKPRYMMGVGSPRELIECVGQGIDIFDSVWPTRNARHGQALTSKGKLSIENKIYRKDLKPIDNNCGCKICKSYTRAYLHHLFRTKEQLGMKLLSYHNLYFLEELMRNIKDAIKEGSFRKLKNEYR